MHTRWIETEFDNTIRAVRRAASPTAPEAAGERQSVVVEVGGKRLEVVLPGGLSLAAVAPAQQEGAQALGRRPVRRRGLRRARLTAPMQGTIVKIAVEEGQQVEAGDLVVVLEAMKMEQPITAHKAGTVTGLKATVGQTVTNGAVLADITRLSRPASGHAGRRAPDAGPGSGSRASPAPAPATARSGHRLVRGRRSGWIEHRAPAGVGSGGGGPGRGRRVGHRLR